MKFQGLLEKKEDGSITGPMSPVLAAREVAKVMNFRIHGLVRVWGEGVDGYDHLIIKTNWRMKGSPVSSYHMFIDTGSSVIPLGSWFTNDKESYITEVYREQFNPGAMQDHRDNTEMRKGETGSPILYLTEREFVKLCKDAEKSGEFDYG